MQTLNLAPILIGFVVLFTIIGALKGLTRGISRQVIRTVTIVISVIIAFFIARGSYTAVVRFLDGKTMADVIGWLSKLGIFGTPEELAWLNNIDMETIKLVLTIPLTLIVMPIAFVAVFVIVSGFMLIIHAILSALFGFSKKRNNIATRLCGMLLGLVQGLAVAGFLLMPIVGLGTAADNAVTVLNEQAPEDETTKSLTQTYDKYAKSLTQNFLFKMYSKLGINALYKGVTTVNTADGKIDTTTLIPDVAKVTGDVMSLKGCDFKNLTPENEEDINSIITTLDNNLYLKKIFAGSVKTAAHMIKDSGTAASLGEPIGSILSTALTIFETTDITTVVSDTNTIRDVYFTLSRDGVLNSFDQGSDALLSALTQRDAEGNTTVNKVLNTIKQNERTKPLITLITQISISVISQQMGLDSSVVETYENIVSDISNDVISIDKNEFATEEEYVSAVSDSLDSTLKNNNIELETEIVDEMAQYIATNYSDIKEIDVDQANDIILSYYDAYLKNQQLPEGLPEGFPEGLPEGFPEGLPEGLPEGFPGLPNQ